MLTQLENFLTYLSAERGRSPETVATYRKRLRNIVTWCAARGITDWEEFPDGSIRDFLLTIDNEAYRANYVIALKSFYRFAEAELGMVDTGQNLSVPKRWKRLPKSLSASQIDTLLAPIEPATVATLCDQAVLELAYSSGLRLGELRSLRIESVNLIERVARVRGKGDKERMVPIGRQAAQNRRTPHQVRRTLFRARRQQRQPDGGWHQPPKLTIMTLPKQHRPELKGPEDFVGPARKIAGCQVSKREKAKFIRQLCHSVSKDLCGKLGRVPHGWNGTQLREWIADEFDKCRHIKGRKVFFDENALLANRNAVREYENDKIINNL